MLERDKWTVFEPETPSKEVNGHKLSSGLWTHPLDVNYPPPYIWVLSVFLFIYHLLAVNSPLLSQVSSTKGSPFISKGKYHSLFLLFVGNHLISFIDPSLFIKIFKILKKFWLWTLHLDVNPSNIHHLGREHFKYSWTVNPSKDVNSSCVFVVIFQPTIFGSNTSL